jgi:hypothetical protein
MPSGNCRALCIPDCTSHFLGKIGRQLAEGDGMILVKVRIALQPFEQEESKYVMTAAPFFNFLL